MTLHFPGESPAYRAARDQLLEQEVALRRQMEAVAVARRASPVGGLVPQDYLFDAIDAEGRRETRALSSLFRRESRAIYRMMFPRDPEAADGGKLSVKTQRL